MSLLSALRTSRSGAKEGSEPSRSGRAGSGSTVGPLAVRAEPRSQARPWETERLVSMAAGAPWVIQRKCAACAEEEQTLQRRAKPGALNAPEDVPAVVGEVLRSSGRALDASARAYFEPRFGRTFDDVRIHNDAQADASARAVSAVAYTVGRDVVFRRGSFAPETAEGKELLAHELAHVVQQSGRAGPAGRGGALTIGAATDPAEREADRTAEKVVRGELGGATTARATADALQRQEVCDEEGNYCWSEDDSTPPEEEEQATDSADGTAGAGGAPSVDPGTGGAEGAPGSYTPNDSEYDEELDTEEGDTWQTFKEGAAGVAYGALQGLTPGGFVAPSPMPQSSTFELFRGLGQIGAGVAETIIGGGGEIVGFGLDATGVGAIAGVPLNVASAIAMANGVTSILGGAGTLISAMSRHDEEGDRRRSGPREKTRGANRADARQVDGAAREAGIQDRRGFGKFIEQEKAAAVRGGSDNYTYEELLQLAEEFKNSGGK